MFDKLHKGIIEKREKLDYFHCQSNDCDVDSKFDDCEDLLMHVKTHMVTQSSTTQILEFINGNG